MWPISITSIVSWPVPRKILQKLLRRGGIQSSKTVSNERAVRKDTGSSPTGEKKRTPKLLTCPDATLSAEARSETRVSGVCTGVAGASASAVMGEVRFAATSPGPPRRSSVGRDSEDRSVTPTRRKHPRVPRGGSLSEGLLRISPGAEVRDSCDWDPHFMILVFSLACGNGRYFWPC